MENTGEKVGENLAQLSPDSFLGPIQIHNHMENTNTGEIWQKQVAPHLWLYSQEKTSTTNGPLLFWWIKLILICCRIKMILIFLTDICN